MKGIKKRSVAFGLIAVIVVLLILGRAYLPYWVTDYLNTQIAALDGYAGSLEDVDIHLWRGAYVVHGLEIHKLEGGLKEPFVAAETIDLSVEWSALLDGAVVAEIDIHDADLNFSRTQSGEGAGWQRLVEAWSPFDINRLTIHGGRVAYIDYSTEPNVHLFIDDIEARVTNLRNVERGDPSLPSDLNITGHSIGDGELTVEGKLNVVKSTPDFDIDLALRGASLAAFNDYTKAAAAIDFESGTVGLFSELAAVDGRLTGYLKTVATDISVVDLSESDQNPINALWESAVSVFMDVFKNQPEDQFAFRIPIEGNLNDPERGTWAAFLSIFDNAFGQAFTRDTDGNIRFEELLED
ncbi:DUF748 domain-containing protein [Guyparkeria sp. SCN-R1]|uniref:DUF748 domain-containing protein n=1 Tax=Guyparkeria sp. SCN-R1 TaxID=2341113 RepID=UPI000F64B781|nr:DUF748 domain-containing protein [Guyparkeria sp. SCN-R1]RRQ24235.1 DUF748 domain-containing protein [Guyparkeria sp. SCN-R1]